TAVMSSVPVEKAGVGSAMNDTTRQLGGALGVAVLGTVATGLYVNGVAPLQSMVSPEAFSAISAGLQTAISPAPEALIDPDIFPPVVETAQAAFMTGMNQAFFVGAMVMYASALFAFLVLPDVVESRRTRQKAAAAHQAPVAAEALPVQGQD